MKPQVMVLALMAVGSAHAQAQIYKCPDAGGRTVIQQTPCAGGQPLKVRPASGFDNAENAAAAERRKAVSNQDILMGIAQGRPEVGMSENHLRMAMGNPRRIHQDNLHGQRSDQWIYERPDGTWYVYVNDGMVHATQFRNYANAPSSDRYCPTTIDIRNLETSANSVTISKERRRALQREVASAKACR